MLIEASELKNPDGTDPKLDGRTTRRNENKTKEKRSGSMEKPNTVCIFARGQSACVFTFSHAARIENSDVSQCNVCVR